MIPLDQIGTGAAGFGVALSPEQLAAMDTYGNFLIEYNQKVNLTAITDPFEIAIKHFVDSLAPLGMVDIPKGASLIDVGTGAGFPGVPMKIARPDLRLCLLDSQKKRLVFLRELSERLGQDNAFLHSRAETAGADGALRGRFDAATARAVAQLSVLCEYCLPLLRVGGVMLALKGPDCAGEINAARRAAALLGGGVPRGIEYALPDQSRRTLVIVDKVAPTPKKYPRQRVALGEHPL